ncbi:MAG: GNAT family N-acetyltransferase [Casimicrobiaceae bacterium]
MDVALVTPRLVLRPFRDGDLDDLHAMDGDDRVMRYIGTGLPGRTRQQAADALGRMITYSAGHPGYGLLHASRRDDGYFVGGCGLFPLPDTDDIEIAYRLRHDCWGHGYATEMARAVLEHGFAALQLPRIVGVAYPENLPSQGVLRKIGMRDDGTAVHYGRTMRVFSAAHRLDS